MCSFVSKIQGGNNMNAEVHNLYNKLIDAWNRPDAQGMSDQQWLAGGAISKYS